MITELGKFGEFEYALAPMEHQQKWFLETRDWPYFAAFWEMGSGKTKTAIDTAAWLFLKGEIDGLLIISDKGSYENWTNTEIPIHMPKNIPYRQTVWRSTMGKYATQEVNKILVAKDDMLDIVVMNTEAFAHDKAPVFAKAFLENHYGMVVIDEADSIKSPTSKRTQAIIELRDLTEYRRILTGTPISNSPLDIYMQAEFLNRGLLGDSFVVFRAEYAHIMLVDPSGGNAYGANAKRGKRYYKIIGYKNLDKLKERIKPWSSRLTKAECLDLPDKVYLRRNVEHTPEQARMYKEIKELAVTQYSGGLLTATSAMTALTKLHQINCGHVVMNPTGDETTGDTVLIPSNRITELLEVLSKIDGKVIIWACFRKDFELIGEALTKEYGRESWVHYYGGTPDTQRPNHLSAFLNNQSVRFFVSNPATGGRSLTLTVASYAVYYSYSWRLALRLQSEDRNHRKGQVNKCTYIDLCTPKTVDVKILHSYKVKKDLASAILDNFSTILDDETEEIRKEKDSADEQPSLDFER